MDEASRVTDDLHDDPKLAFDIAFGDGRYDDAWDLLEAHPAIRDARFWAGKTPLMMCALDGIGPMVKWLLENGADPSLKSEGEWTGLHFSASSGLPSTRCAQYLINAGLSPLEPD